MKRYSEEDLYYKYEGLSNKNKVGILSTALSYMQQYNGRSTEVCILMAMGYDYECNNDGYKLYYKKT